MREHTQVYYLWQLIKTVRNWPIYILNRLGFLRGNRITYRLRNGFTITSRNFIVDRGAINEVWLDRIYDPPDFHWSQCSTIVDIGANIGTFTLFAASKAPRARIIALEPEPVTASALRTNIDQNALQGRITLDERGLAAESGERTFYVANKCSWFSSLYRKESDDTHPITIKVATLGDVLDAHAIDQCDFLKLDCEGAEYESLYGLPDRYWQRLSFIALEFHTFTPHPKGNVADLRAFLVERSYRVTERPNNILFAERVPR